MTPPLMTVVLVTPGRYDALRDTLDHLAAQRIAERLELVVVAPSTAALGPEPAAVGGFHSRSLVETGPFRSTGHAVAAGVRCASGPIVVYVEEHVAPEPDWAEALVEAFDGPWAAVGPALVNANPGSRTSWAAFVQDYGPWLDPIVSGERDRLPVHQAAFDRAVLLALGEEFETLFEGEILFDELRSRGLASTRRRRRDAATSTSPGRPPTPARSFWERVSTLRAGSAGSDGQRGRERSTRLRHRAPCSCASVIASRTSAGSGRSSTSPRASASSSC